MSGRFVRRYSSTAGADPERLPRRDLPHSRLQKSESEFERLGDERSHGRDRNDVASLFEPVNCIGGKGRDDRMRDHGEPLNHHVMHPVGYALSLKHDPGDRGVARGRASPSSEIRDFGGGSTCVSWRLHPCDQQSRGHQKSRPPAGVRGTGFRMGLLCRPSRGGGMSDGEPLLGPSG